MTDNEIIKALECCSNLCGNDCYECPRQLQYYDSEIECGVDLMSDALSLINRQKAEIERLSKKNEELAEVLSDTIRIRYAEAQAEAIKEFAERLKALPECQDVPAVLAVIDDLVKEMVGDSDEN